MSGHRGTGTEYENFEALVNANQKASTSEDLQNV